MIWNDPGLAIPWPLAGAGPNLSAKDRLYGTLASPPSANLDLVRSIQGGLSRGAAQTGMSIASRRSKHAFT